MSAIERSSTSGCRRILETIDGVTEDREYLVDAADPEAAVGDINVPKLRASHPSRVGLYVISRELTRQAHNKVLVHLQYSDRGVDAGEEHQTELGMEIGAEEETVYVDLDGNSLGDAEKREGGASVYRPREIDTVTTWEKFINPGIIRRLVGKVNREPFMGELACTFLYLGATIRRVGKDNYQVMHRFMYSDDGHYFTRPWIVEECTGEGKDKQCKDVVKTTDTGSPILEIFPIYEEGDFGLLGLSL